MLSYPLVKQSTIRVWVWLIIVLRSAIPTWLALVCPDGRGRCLHKVENFSKIRVARTTYKIFCRVPFSLRERGGVSFGYPLPLLKTWDYPD
jgi:hypothetical protein